MPLLYWSCLTSIHHAALDTSPINFPFPFERGSPLKIEILENAMYFFQAHLSITTTAESTICIPPITQVAKHSHTFQSFTIPDIETITSQCRILWLVMTLRASPIRQTLKQLEASYLCIHLLHLVHLTELSSTPLPHTSHIDKNNIVSITFTNSPPVRFTLGTLHDSHHLTLCQRLFP